MPRLTDKTSDTVAASFHLIGDGLGQYAVAVVDTSPATSLVFRDFAWASEKGRADVFKFILQLDFFGNSHTVISSVRACR